MSSTEHRLRIAHEEGIVRVGFVDRNILDEGSIQLIGEEINRIIDGADEPRLLINFEDVDHLSSAALGTLISVNNRIREKGGQLRLANIDPQIYEVFAITKLNKLFEIHETTGDAIASFM